MKNKKGLFFDLLSGIDEELLSRALARRYALMNGETPARRRPTLYRVAALAAAVFILLAGILSSLLVLRAQGYYVTDAVLLSTEGRLDAYRLTYQLTYRDGGHGLFTLETPPSHLPRSVELCDARGGGGLDPVSSHTVEAASGRLYLCAEDGARVDLGNRVGEREAGDNAPADIVGLSLADGTTDLRLSSGGEMILDTPLTGEFALSSVRVDRKGEMRLRLSGGAQVKLGRVADENGQRLYGIAVSETGALSAITPMGDRVPLGSLEDGGRHSVYEMYRESYGYTGDEDSWTDALVGDGRDVFVFDNRGTIVGLTPYGGELERLVIPQGVTHIADFAFYNNARLCEVVFPKSLVEIGNYAFDNCGGLASVTFSEGLARIGDRAFANCLALRELTFPDSLRDVGTHAFFGCMRLLRVTLGTGCGNGWNESIFDGCECLIEMICPDGVAWHGLSYYSCTVHDGTVSLLETDADGFVFTTNFCGNLTPHLVDYVGKGGSVTLPDSFHGQNYAVGPYVFWERMDVTAVTIPDGVTELGGYAFSNSGVRSVNLFDLRATLGFGVFSGCQFLTDVKLPSDLRVLPAHSFNNCRALVSVVLPKGLEEIGACAFDGCESLTRLSLPAGMRVIGDSAFSYSGLRVIELPAELVEIGDEAFRSCFSLERMSFPDGLTRIGRYAFAGCHLLSTIELPPELAEIGFGAFEACDSLEWITIPYVGCTVSGYDIANGISDLSFFGAIFGAVSALDQAEYLPRSIGVEICGGDIPAYAFYGCDLLMRVQFGDAVGDIGSYAFFGCTELDLLLFSENSTVTDGKISGWAFGNCIRLPEVRLPEGYQTIAGAAFGGCHELSRIELPTTLTVIGNHAFADSLLLTVYARAEAPSAEWATGWCPDGTQVLYGEEMPS